MLGRSGYASVFWLVGVKQNDPYTSTKENFED
jgi:hypothetical protein